MSENIFLFYKQTDQEAGLHILDGLQAAEFTVNGVGIEGTEDELGECIHRAATAQIVVFIRTTTSQWDLIKSYARSDTTQRQMIYVVTVIDGDGAPSGIILRHVEHFMIQREDIATGIEQLIAAIRAHQAEMQWQQLIENLIQFVEMARIHYAEYFLPGLHPKIDTWLKQARHALTLRASGASEQAFQTLIHVVDDLGVPGVMVMADRLRNMVDADTAQSLHDQQHDLRAAQRAGELDEVDALAQTLLSDISAIMQDLTDSAPDASPSKLAEILLTSQGFVAAEDYKPTENGMVEESPDEIRFGDVSGDGLIGGAPRQPLTQVDPEAAPKLDDLLSGGEGWEANMPESSEYSPPREKERKRIEPFAPPSDAPAPVQAAPKASRRRASVGAAAKPVDAPPQFSAFHPTAVQPSAAYTLMVFVHTAAVFAQIEAIARNYEPMMGGAQSSASTRSKIEIAQGSLITFVPSISGITFTPAEQVVPWQAPHQSAIFAFTTPADLPAGSLTGSVIVYQGPLILGDIPISMAVATADQPVSAIPDQAANLERLNPIFASYSHRDTPVMEFFRRNYRQLGQKMLVDRYDLLSGDHWNPRLLEMIDESAVFQLFWSEHSAQSEYCRQEWEHALQCADKRPRFIRPVWWEAPMTPPPPELSDLHFQRVPLPALTRAQMAMARVRGLFKR